MTPDRTVIVGAGIAGVSAAVAMRAAGYDGEVVLVNGEAQLPYRRTTVSKEIVRREREPDQVRIKPATWYETQRIDLRSDLSVESIDAQAHALALSDGSTLEYSQLLLTTGGRARTLADGVPGVVTLRRIDDAEALHHLGEGDAVVVVGAGLIGSEIAASLRALGAEVTLLETADLPLPRLLPPEIGQMYVDLHKDQGTDLHTGVTIESFETVAASDTQAVKVRATDGREWVAPLVVEAVGMVPNTELAEAAGIRLDPDFGGIAVDEFGRTSVPDVYAAGDVAAMPEPIFGGRQRVEHWQNAQHHGTAVGAILAGGTEPFREVPWAWSDQYDYNLQTTGWPAASDEIVLRGSLAERNFVAFFLGEEGVIRGAIGIDRPMEIRAVRKWIAEHVAPDRAKLADESVPIAEAVAR
jgi:NADPH-dependent 2,4-dienoyl-CoA reductase/sulfur reductase-like enzyme